jgi:hypothetical protein
MGSSSVPTPSSSCDWMKISPDTAASSDTAITLHCHWEPTTEVGVVDRILLRMRTIIRRRTTHY